MRDDTGCGIFSLKALNTLILEHLPVSLFSYVTSEQAQRMFNLLVLWRNEHAVFVDTYVE
jgi:hypothetical protein